MYCKVVDLTEDNDRRTTYMRRSAVKVNKTKAATNRYRLTLPMGSFTIPILHSII